MYISDTYYPSLQYGKLAHLLESFRRNNVQNFLDMIYGEKL
jgi:hypothetical protein